MLGGLDPIILFQFGKVFSGSFGLLTKIPITSDENSTVILLPPIPIYLSESLTGIYIDSEDKNVDIETDTQTKTDGGTPDVTQKGLSSTVSINLVGKKDSLGLTLLSSLIDILFEKVTSREYSISYLHGPTTIFGALLHSYSVNQNATNELLTMKIELTKGNKNPSLVPQVTNNPAIRGLTP